MTRLIRRLLAAAAVLTLSGCGTDVPSREAQVRDVPRAQLIAGADRICRASKQRLAGRIARLPSSRAASSWMHAIAPMLEVYAQAASGEVAQITALGPPAEREDALDDYLNQRTTEANALGAAAVAARDENATGLEARLDQIRGERAIALAKRFGFQVCAASAAPRRGQPT